MLENLKNYRKSVLDGTIQGGTYHEYGDFSKSKENGKRIKREKKR
jgi:hypothetical protein